MRQVPILTKGDKVIIKGMVPHRNLDGYYIHVPTDSFADLRGKGWILYRKKIRTASIGNRSRYKEPSPGIAAFGF